MGNIWLTSDLHLNHDKPFIYEARGFETIDEMNKKLVENFNEMIEDEDTLYILGDIMLGNEDEKGIELVHSIKGHKHLIAGNHDTPRRLTAYKEAGIFESIQYALPLVVGKWHYFLSHYPMLTMNNDTRPDVVSLYGHSHQFGNWTEETPWQTSSMYNVGVDAHFLKPIDIRDIKLEIRAQIEIDKQEVR